MFNKILMTAVLVGAASAATMANAATMYYVAQDAKTHACSVMNAKPDGKMAMDVGTKAYDSMDNANKAMANLKACASSAMAAPKAAGSAMAAPGFYVAQDAKTKKCMVSDKKPDGKMAMDVGTKMYDSKGNAEKAMAMLNACK